MIIPNTAIFRRLAAGLAIGIAAWLLAAVMGRIRFFETIELKTYDLRMRVTVRQSRGLRLEIA